MHAAHLLLHTDTAIPSCLHNCSCCAARQPLAMSACLFAPTGGPGGPPRDICCMPAAACCGLYPGIGAAPAGPMGPGIPGGRIIPPLGGPLAIGMPPGGGMPYWPGGGPAQAVQRTHVGSKQHVMHCRSCPVPSVGVYSHFSAGCAEIARPELDQPRCSQQGQKLPYWKPPKQHKKARPRHVDQAVQTQLRQVIIVQK